MKLNAIFFLSFLFFLISCNQDEFVLQTPSGYGAPTTYKQSSWQEDWKQAEKLALLEEKTIQPEVAKKKVASQKLRRVKRALSKANLKKKKLRVAHR